MGIEGSSFDLKLGYLLRLGFDLNSSFFTARLGKYTYSFEDNKANHTFFTFWNNAKPMDTALGEKVYKFHEIFKTFFPCVEIKGENVILDTSKFNVSGRSNLLYIERENIKLVFVLRSYIGFDLKVEDYGRTIMVNDEDFHEVILVWTVNDNKVVLRLI